MLALLIQGAEDLLTTPEVGRAYFENIIAPEKRYILVPQAGHDPNLVMLRTQLDAIRKYILPLIAQ